MKVHILTDKNFVSYYFFFPVLANRRRLADLGIKVSFFQTISEKMWDCDALLLDSKFFKYWPNRSEILALLEENKSPHRQIIWLDGNASSGTTYFQIMPYVDKYWKKQLLKDISLYKNSYKGARIFTDYYHEKYGIEVSENYQEVPLQDEFKEKLSLSWNLGVGPYGRHIKVSNFFCQLPWYIKERLPLGYRNHLVPSGGHRKKNIVFRGSSKYSNSGIDFQRMKILEKTAQYSIDTSAVSYSEYFSELKEAKLAVSPFGFGEVCYRDFEIFVAGAALVKPSMDHMKTYPNYYVSDETYLSIDWDLENFEEKIDLALSSPDLMGKIAESGQRMFSDFISLKGQDEFCERFKEKLLHIPTP